MARPYKIKEGQIDGILEALKKQLIGHRCEATELKVDLKDDRYATVCYTPSAWAKMTALIACFSTEIEWHYCARRLSESVFEIFDVVVPPHVVTGTTVTSDDDKYAAWIAELPDEVYNNLRGHGHSHVNMQVVPSAVDEAYRKDLVTQIVGGSENDAFYIFMIFNKSYIWSAQVFDIKNNLVYESDDVDLCVDLDDGMDVYTFVANARKLATAAPSRPVYNNGTWYGGQISQGGATKTSEGGKTSAKKPSSKGSAKNNPSYGYDDESDYDPDDIYGNYHDVYGRRDY